MVPWTWEISKHSILQQGNRNLQGFLQFLEGNGPDSNVSRAARLVQLQCLLCILANRGHQGGLVTALRHPDVHLGSAQASQPFGQFGMVAGVLRNQDFPGNPALNLAVFSVDLLQQMFDEFRRRGILHFFHHPAALPADPATANVEHLYGGFEFVLVQGEDVRVGVLGEDHCVAFKDLAERDDVIPESGCALVVQFGYGGRHVLLQTADEAFGFAAHEGTEIFCQPTVFVRGNAADAGRRAFVDVTQKAGPSAGLRTLEDACAATPHGENPQESVHGFPDGTGSVGTKVPGPFPSFPAHDLHPGVLLPHGDREVGISFVIPEHHIEPWLEFLDPGVFQLQRFQLAAHHGPFNAAGGVDHCMGLGKEPRRVGEVGVQPRAEVFCLAHIDDPTMGVTETIDAWGGGNFTRLGPVTCWICHVSSLVNRNDTHCHGVQGRCLLRPGT